MENQPSPSSSSSETTSKPKSNGYIDRKVAKEFTFEGEKMIFFGIVKDFAGNDENGNPLWTVIYEDEDREDFHERELCKAINFAQEVEKKNQNGEKMKVYQQS